jgi:hypothetical protein
MYLKEQNIDIVKSHQMKLVVLTKTYPPLTHICPTPASPYPIFRHIKSNNSGMAQMKIVKNERNPPLFTSK